MHAQGNLAVVIGVAGADDGYREAGFPIGFHQHLLTGNLVPGILPVGVRQSGAFGDAIVHDGLVVGRGGAGEQILLCPSRKQPNVPFHLLWLKSDELAHAVKGQPPDCLLHIIFIVHIRLNPVNSAGHFLRG